MATDLYPYGQTYSRTEIDLRAEFNKILDGSGYEISKAKKGLLRRMRRDSNDELTQCECSHAITGEPDKDIFCPLCYGEGYRWDESWLYYFKNVITGDARQSLLREWSPMGEQTVEIAFFYLKSHIEIDNRDKIVELQMTSEGILERPYTRLAIYRLGLVLPYRSDNGRIEYIQAAGVRENVKYPNGR